jgi:WD40 repeat protein
LVTASQDATVRVWNVSTGTCAATLQGKGDPFYAAAFSPDGTRLAAVGDDFMLRVWSTRGFSSLLQKKLSREAIYAVTFLNDGRSVAVGGADTVIRLLPYPTTGQTRSAGGAHAQ